MVVVIINLGATEGIEFGFALLVFVFWWFGVEFSVSLVFGVAVFFLDLEFFLLLINF